MASQNNVKNLKETRVKLGNRVFHYSHTKSKDLFSTLNISKEAFCKRNEQLKAVNYFYKKLHHICLDVIIPQEFLTV